MKKSALLLSLLVLATGARSQGLVFPGGRGLMHVHSALTLDRGAVTLHGYTTSYYKTVLVRNDIQGAHSVTFWDVQGALALHVATGRHLELGLTQLVYQDTHRGENGYDAPSDLALKIKYGSLGKPHSRLRLGLLIEGRIPLAKHHNILFEPYSAGRFEMGVTGLLSYTTDLLIPEAGFNMHFNVGFWHHNDVGKFLTGVASDNVAVLSPSRRFVWGWGFVLPSTQFDFALEFFGQLFAVRPPETAYSREDFVYMTPSVLFRLSNKVAFNAGLDVRLTRDEDKTQYNTLPRVHPDLPSYPAWRVRVGTRIYLNKSEPREVEQPLFTRSTGESTSPSAMTETSGMTLQEQLVRERRETEIAEEELAKIREDRKKMEAMLARLRQILQYGKPLETEEMTKKNAVEEKEKVTKKNN